MKKVIKQVRKRNASPGNKKTWAHFTAKKAGYKEEVYHGEQQHNYEKSDLANNSKKNTSGPE